MKKMKIAAVLLVTAVLALGAAGCGAKFDAKSYVQGGIDAQYKNEVSDEYVKITNGGREEIEAQYNANIEAMSAEIIEGCPEELVPEFKTATVNLLKATKYTVGDAVKGEGNNYTVPVEIEPLITDMTGIVVRTESHIKAKFEELGDTADEETLIYELFSFMLGEYQAISENPVYGEPKTINVRVQEVSKGLYDIPMEDQEAIYLAIFSM